MGVGFPHGELRIWVAPPASRSTGEPSGGSASMGQIRGLGVGLPPGGCGKSSMGKSSSNGSGHSGGWPKRPTNMKADSSTVTINIIDPFAKDPFGGGGVSAA